VKVFRDRERRKNLPAFCHLPDAEVADTITRPARDVAAAIADRAACRSQHAGDGADQRSLARTVRADDRDDRTFFHFERGAVERLRIAVAYVDALDGEHQIDSAPR